MSVKVCDRKQGKLATLTKAIEFAAHTIKVCDNEGIFPKRHRMSITADIIKESKQLPKLINRANKNKGNKRLELQDQAVDLIDDIEMEIETAYVALFPNISEQKIDYWIGLLVELRVLLKAWIKSDAKTVNN